MVDGTPTNPWVFPTKMMIHFGLFFWGFPTIRGNTQFLCLADGANGSIRPGAAWKIAAFLADV